SPGDDGGQMPDRDRRVGAQLSRRAGASLHGPRRGGDAPATEVQAVSGRRPARRGGPDLPHQARAPAVGPPLPLAAALPLVAAPRTAMERHIRQFAFARARAGLAAILFAAGCAGAGGGAQRAGGTGAAATVAAGKFTPSG